MQARNMASADIVTLASARYTKRVEYSQKGYLNCGRHDEYKKSVVERELADEDQTSDNYTSAET
jgi:hypothetical protein